VTTPEVSSSANEAVGLLAAVPTVGVTLLTVVGMIVVGAVARRQAWLDDAADAAMLKLLVRLFIPALIVDRVLGNPALDDWRNVLWPPVLAFGFVTAGIFLAWGLARLLQRGRADPVAARRGRTFALTTGMFNYGYVSIPLVGGLFDDDTLGVLFVFNLGVEAAMWGVGLTVLAGSFSKGWWRRLLGPPVVATVVALLVDATLGRSDVVSNLPAVGRGTISAGGQMLAWLGEAAIPLGLILTGSTFADQWQHGRLRQGVPTVAAASVLRLGLLPVAIVLLAVTLPITPDLRRVLIVQAAMPAAVFPVVLARHYDGDVGTALRVVVGTSLLSLVTMPIWITLGLWLIT
jgi:predicted permease